jgi:hypothetical protein
MVVKGEGERGMRDEGRVAPVAFVPPRARLHPGACSSPLSADEHAIALYVYFVDFDDFQYSRDLWQHYTTWTML